MTISSKAASPIRFLGVVPGRAGRSWHAAQPRSICKNFATAEAAVDWIYANRNRLDMSDINIYDESLRVESVRYLG